MAAGEFSDRVNRVSYSQANTGLIVEGMARAGLYDEAIVTLEDQWGRPCLRRHHHLRDVPPLGRRCAGA